MSGFWMKPGSILRHSPEWTPRQFNVDDPEDRENLERIVRRYSQVTTDAIRRYDRHHLIFGSRFDRPSDIPDWLIEAAVGLHWCAFLENRARKSGLKNHLDEPYEECVSRMREFNRNRLYTTALGERR